MDIYPKFIIIQDGTFADGKGTAAHQIAEHLGDGVYCVSDVGPNDPVHFETALVRLAARNAAATGRPVELPEPIKDRMRDDGWEVRSAYGELLYVGTWSGASTYCRNHDIPQERVSHRPEVRR